MCRVLYVVENVFDKIRRRIFLSTLIVSDVRASSLRLFLEPFETRWRDNFITSRPRPPGFTNSQYDFLKRLCYSDRTCARVCAINIARTKYIYIHIINSILFPEKCNVGGDTRIIITRDTYGLTGRERYFRKTFTLYFV